MCLYLMCSEQIGAAELSQIQMTNKFREKSEQKWIASFSLEYRFKYDSNRRLHERE